MRTSSARCSAGDSQPSVAGELNHAGASLRLIGVLGKTHIPVARGIVACDLPQRSREGRRLSLALTQRCKQAFDALEKHANFRHVAAQDAVDEVEFLRRRQPVVQELTRLGPIAGARIRVAHAAGDRRSRLGSEVTEEPRDWDDRCQLLRSTTIADSG